MVQNKLILFTFIVVLSTAIPLLREDVAEQIFHNNHTYIIYVSGEKNQNVEKVFEEYCSIEGNLCAIINSEIQQYQDLRGFIGVQSQNYFVILRAHEQSKYVCEIQGQFSVQHLNDFKQSVEDGSAEPHFSSEQIPQQNDEFCQKVVGKTLNSFLQSSAPVKTIFLYTEDLACQVCLDMLQAFRLLSKKMYDPNVVSFGYFDLFKNDHEIMKDRALPFFLIFKEGNPEPVEVQGKQMESLYRVIIDTVMDGTDIDEEEMRKLLEEKGVDFSDYEDKVDRLLYEDNQIPIDEQVPQDVEYADQDMNENYAEYQVDENDL